MKVTRIFTFAALTLGLCVSSVFGQSGTKSVPPIVQGGGNPARIITPIQNNTVQPQIVTPNQGTQTGQDFSQSQTYFENGGNEFAAGGQGIGNGRFGAFGDNAVPSSWQNERSRIYGGVLYMTREKQGSNFNILQTAGGAAPILTRDNFDFDYEVGFELGLRQKVGPMFEIDARYMQIDSMNAPSVPFNMAIGDEINTTPPTPLFTNLTGVANYGSNLHSGEINFLKQYSTNTKVGLGFRMVQLSELLQLNITPAVAAPVQVNMETHNFLYGAQFTTETLLLHTNRMRWDFFSKNGIYGNNANREFTTAGPLLMPNPARLEDRDFSFLGESGIRGSFRISNCLSISGGYHALYIAGVALAPDQIRTTNQAQGGGNFAPLQTDMSDTLYHGAFVNIEFRR